MFARRTTCQLVIGISLLTSSCAGSLFKVKPATELPPLSSDTRSANAGNLAVRVAPLLTDEQTQDLFEANLPLNGVLPVRLELAFQSGTAVDLSKVRFRLHDAQGREWKWLSSRQAVARIMRANEITLYNPNSRKQFEEDFGAYAIDIKTPLSDANLRREGFVFFQTPDKRPAQTNQQLTMTIERLPQPVTVALN